MGSKGLVLASLLALAPSALAGFDAASNSNIAVYWGQNSAGGADTQSRLATYCENAAIDIIPLAFMNGINPPIVNFASASNYCTSLESGVLRCPQIEEDIGKCQAMGKTILISLGGATYTEGGFPSRSDAEAQAANVWAMFGPNQNDGADRPFGNAVVDGFDFDFESAVSNLPAFGAKLRNLMDDAHAGGDKQYFLSAAPQCPFPDAADGDTLNSVAFDMVFIQFYNNYCGVSSYTDGGGQFNFGTWDEWAKNTSPNKAVKLLVGIPASSGAGGGFASGRQLAGAIDLAKTYDSMGGVMMWDMSQLYANSGFLEEVVSDLS